MKWTGLYIYLMLISLPVPATAQFLGGFFNQKGTQRKYMLEQIALYRLYLGYAKKGYGIAKDELHMVGDIRSGELGLHQGFYTSLRTARPAIANSDDVKAILHCCDKTARLMNAANASSAKILLTSDEQAYIARVNKQVQKELSRITGALDMNLSQIQATDDERMKRNSDLRSAAQDIYSFAVSFSGKVQAIAAGRAATQKQTQIIKRLYDLP